MSPSRHTVKHARSALSRTSGARVIFREYSSRYPSHLENGHRYWGQPRAGAAGRK